MNYHMIRTDDMLNGDGLRVIIFLSGCHHHCEGCHNPETWDENSGTKFTMDAALEILSELNKDYISGITLSGGDPLHQNNLSDVNSLISIVKQYAPNKSVWLYTGFTWEDIWCSEAAIRNDYALDYCERISLIHKKQQDIISLCDVVCDGKFIKTLADVNCPWVGSTNQRVIDVKKSLDTNSIVLYKES